MKGTKISTLDSDLCAWVVSVNAVALVHINLISLIFKNPGDNPAASGKAQSSGGRA